MWRLIKWRGGVARCRLCAPTKLKLHYYPRSCFSSGSDKPPPNLSDPQTPPPTPPTNASTSSSGATSSTTASSESPRSTPTSTTTTSTSTATSTSTTGSTGAFRPLKQTKLRMPEGFTAADSSLQAKQAVEEEEEDELGYQKPENTHRKQKSGWRKYSRLIVGMGVFVVLWFNGPLIRQYSWRGTIKYLGWASEPTYVLSALSVMGNMEADFTNFILLGGVPKLLHLAKTSPNEEARMGSLVVLHAMSGNPYFRREICEAYPEFVAELLEIVVDVNPANKTTVGAALNVLYNYLGDKQWFYDEFMKLKGFDTLMKCMKSPEPEIGNFAGQLVGLFIMENPDWFKTQKFKDANAVFSALANMAAIYQDAGKSEYALKAYECIMRIDNKNPMILTQMGLEMLKVGREEGIDWLLKSLEINPRQLEAAFGLAKHTLKANTSEANIKKAINVLLAGLPELKRVNTAQFQDGKHPLAPKVYNFLVNLYLKINDLEAALEMAQDWASYAVADANALATTGKILLLQGDFREALGPLGAALRLNPRLAQTHLHRAICLSSIGRDDLALVVCQEGIQVDGELRRAGEQRCEYERARAEQACKQAEYYSSDEKKVKEAERIIAGAKRAEREKPEILVPLYLLGGKLFLKAKQYPEALGCYDTVIKSRPDNVKAYLQKAQALKLKHEPMSQVYSTYATGFRIWLESEKTKRVELEKNRTEANSSAKPVVKPPASKKPAQKGKKGAKSEPEVSGSKAILLREYKRCKTGITGKDEGLKERTDMCRVVQDLTDLLQLQAK